MTPAQALGHELLARGYRVEVITDGRGMRYAPMFEGMKMHEISAGTLGAGLMGKVSGVLNLGRGIMQAFGLVKRLKPVAVVGFGGYPSFPGVYAAQILKVPTILHEQNAIIGKANEMLASKSTRIALSLPLMSGLDEADKARTVLTGNPVRPSIAALHETDYTAPSHDGDVRILVMGGSLGAHVFSHVVPQTLAKLPAEYRKRLDVVQQCRADDVDFARAAYDQAGIKAELATFFDNADELIARTHLFIGRSGASTVAEMAAAGRPSIFVPYPYHKDQQQKMNADVLSDVGGAWTMTESGFTEDALLARIETFFQTPEILEKAAVNAKSCGQPQAAAQLADVVLSVALKGTKPVEACCGCSSKDAA